MNNITKKEEPVDNVTTSKNQIGTDEVSGVRALE